MKKLIMIIVLSSCIKNLNNLDTINKENINDKLINACKEGNNDLVASLLAQKAAINYKDGDGFTALMHASYNRHKEIVEMLIEKGASINEKDKEGWTALMAASYNGHKEIVEMLIEKGASINDKDSDGWNVLMEASQNGHKEVVGLLLNKGANVNDKDKDGWTALMYASANGCIEAVRLLLEKGANANDVDRHGRTLLLVVIDKLKLKLISNEKRLKYLEIVYIIIEGMRKQAISLYSKPINTIEGKVNKRIKNIHISKEASEYIEKSIQLFDFLLYRVPKDIFIHIINYVN